MTTDYGLRTTDNRQQTPLVSFILTYYNKPVKMLCDCIDSILVLSLRPYEREIILIDDGSDISPMNELMKYGKDIIYLRQKNQGLSCARNRGIQLASGQYLQFIDADDMLNQAAYEHCLDIIRYQKPEMVLFDFCNELTHGSTFEDSAMMSGVEYMKNRNIHGTACGYIFSRSILGTLRFTPSIYHEDEEFTPQLLLHAKQICSTDAKAYVYRKHADTIMTKNDSRSKIKRLNDQIYVIKSLRELAQAMPANEQQALQRRIAQLTMGYIYNIILHTRSRHYLDRKLGLLRRDGLFPLPDKNYTTKYRWFRRLTNSDFGLKLLMFAIPLLPKER